MNVINKDIWLVDNFSPKNPHPPWQCPICNLGILKGDKNTLKIKQSQATKKAKFSSNFLEVGDATFRFSGFLICQNSQCKEEIAVVGKGLLFASISNEPVSIQYKGERYSVYYPSYFEPALNIFSVPNSCSLNIKEQIEKSFSHFFNDANSCANAMRTALELILIDQGMLSEKKGFVSLGDRIKEFQKGNANLGKLLEAAKWIGNAGSHETNLDKNALLDGYELLQYVIHELYERKVTFENLITKADKIITLKKPISK